MEKQTDLELLKSTYDKLGIDYHEFKTESGYTFIQKMRAHERKGFIYITEQFKEVPLTSANQLTNFIEFDENDEIASW